MLICSQGSLGVPTLHAGVPIAGTLLSAGCREGNWHNSPQSNSSSEALSWVPSCWERLALSHDELVLSLGDTPSHGPQHHPALPSYSNPHLGHQDIVKRFLCTHLSTPHSPTATPGRCQCQPRLGREPAGSDANAGQQDLAPGQPGAC